MKHVTLLIAGLLLAGLALDDGSPRAAAQSAPKKKDRVVTVDPLDLRQPVPNPELGLSDKYTGKPVRFKGLVVNGGVDAKTKSVWYLLEVAIPSSQVQSAPKETVQVKVSLVGDPKRLRFKVGSDVLTVEGIGDVQSDGSLLINSGQVILPDAGR